MRTIHDYDIHGIITVVSDAALPELAAFRVPGPIAHPTIRVRIDQPSFDGDGRGDQQIRYTEWPGWHGFGVEIAYRDGIEVNAAPLLASSPHVLYTNVVEPILRWTFVQHGFALVHGACLARDGAAVLVTARTDTGKTTTVLRTLDAQPNLSFLSDDLTLLAPDGTVLMYPKPLTISRHTLVAVRTPLLTRRERIGLFFQSRLHSRSGRQFGLLLTRSKLPMATTNAIIQRLVPPPKYPVQRLVPHARLARAARLTGLIVIERGGEGAVQLGTEEATEILMSNCEDSYGFPPYETIKAFLYGGTGRDLRPIERGTVVAALDGLPATLLRSETRDWWRRVPALMSRYAERAATPWLIPAQEPENAVAVTAAD